MSYHSKPFLFLETPSLLVSNREERGLWKIATLGIRGNRAAHVHVLAAEIQWRHRVATPRSRRKQKKVKDVDSVARENLPRSGTPGKNMPDHRLEFGTRSFTQSRSDLDVASDFGPCSLRQAAGAQQALARSTGARQLFGRLSLPQKVPCSPE